MTRDIKAYEDIIHLPHHVSKKRPQMAVRDRAAQFSPFAAVVGHETAVKEAARHTDRKRVLDETQKAVIDERLMEIESRIENCEVEIIYFQADSKKDGGQYLEKVGKVKKLDHYNKSIVMLDGEWIDVEDIYSIVINP